MNFCFLLFQLEMKDGDSDKSGVEYKETKNNKSFDNNESQVIRLIQLLY